MRLIPLDDRVAVVVILAGCAEAFSEVAAGEWPRDEGAGGLHEHGIAGIHPLHHLCVADRRVRVRRYHGLERNARTVESSPDLAGPLEAEANGGADEGGATKGSLPGANSTWPR